MSAFCPACEEDRGTKTEEREETYEVRGRQITVPLTVTVCRTCGEELGSDEQDQEILDAVHGEYRRQVGLLTAEQIKGVRRRYRLSQKSLATLLGMSEATINRYEKGGLQDQVHDNAIRACEDAEYVRDLLQRRGHLLTERQRGRVEEALAGQPDRESTLTQFFGTAEWLSTAYEFSHRTGFRRFSYERFASVVTWLCREMKEVSKTTILKLLFYADFLNYKTATVSLTGTAYRRLQYGPVPSDYGQLLARMEGEGLLTCTEIAYAEGNTGYYYCAGPQAGPSEGTFTAHEQRVLRRVVEAFRNCTAKEISDRSHQETAWKNTEDKQLISYQEAAALSLDLPDEP